MNLLELNALGAQTKPWLNPVCFSLDAETLTCRNMSVDTMVVASLDVLTLGASNTWKQGGAIVVLNTALDVSIPRAALLGGFAHVGAAGTGNLVCPTSAVINAVLLPEALVGAVFTFTVINANLDNVTIGSRLVAPDGAIVSIPIGEALRQASTVFVFQKQPSTQWSCINNLA